MRGRTRKRVYKESRGFAPGCAVILVQLHLAALRLAVMEQQPPFTRVDLSIYNTLSRSKERFTALRPPLVGMYVCGPTVYSDPHLGHARSAVAFDIVFRVLRFLGYRVRFVRNVTDVGHLEDEVASVGEDKIGKRARLEQLEPMEVVQRYTLSYHRAVGALGCLPPSIEPRASAHIMEQIEVVQRILDAGLAYEHEGSVYFDLERYANAPDSSYGALSGKVFEDLKANTRATAGGDDKRGALDFALWKKAEPSHIMRWKSPWGEGFPGWHLECTTMSTRYLGEQFDIHGGGLDLQFPHHEAEIAQNHGAYGNAPARFWIHSNMLTVDGQKMARSLGNYITVEELLTGSHPRLERGFAPMVVRFLMLQSHYRSTIDFSMDALSAAERGYAKLMDALAEAEALLASVGVHPAGVDPGQQTTAVADAAIGSTQDPIAAAGADLGSAAELVAAAGHETDVKAALTELWSGLADDFHAPRIIAALFDLAKLTRKAEHEQSAPLLRTYAARAQIAFTRQVLGLAPSTANDASDDKLAAVMQVLIDLRAQARAAKDFATGDRIRDELAAVGVSLKDGPDGTSWSTE